jgi:hypothetical protein
MSSTPRTIPHDAFEEFPMDFNAYLGRRLGIDREAAMKAVGEWLESYERTSSHPGLAPGRERRSGMFPRPSAHETPATAKTSAA